MSRSLFISAVLLALVSGCAKESAKGEAVPTTTAAQHAAAGVKPGSHEDWCGEHSVPEWQCTRCNASLVAAFKATGDWCSEHGLPESQCVKCDPSRQKVRPPQGQ